MEADLLAWVERVPDPLVYLLLGLGAAIENVVPAIPADTFVLLGGFLTSFGSLEPWWIFLATWSCNSAAAVAMYRLGSSHGRPFFETGWGRRVLSPWQMARMGRFYARWGTFAIFFTRFLPGLRAVVPVFAGVTHQRARAVIAPLALASAIWYGALVWAGAWAGAHLDELKAMLQGANVVLGAAAVAVVLAVAVWWWRTRGHTHE